MAWQSDISEEIADLFVGLDQYIAFGDSQSGYGRIDHTPRGRRLVLRPGETASVEWSRIKVGHGSCGTMHTHGTVSCYIRSGCRCDDCRAAQAAYQRKARAVRKSRPEAGEKHGSRTTYSNGCRCRPCRDAAAAWMRERRRR